MLHKALILKDGWAKVVSTGGIPERVSRQRVPVGNSYCALSRYFIYTIDDSMFGPGKQEIDPKKHCARVWDYL